jgi:voltage-gated potassium channel
MDRARRATLFRSVERMLDIPMLVLSLLFLGLSLSLELLPLSARTTNVIENMLGLIWGLFAAELALKLYLAPDRRLFLRTHWIDVVIVVLPFLRSLRVLRTFVLSSRVLRQIRHMLRQYTLSLVGLTSLVTVGIASALVYLTERETDGPIQDYGDALWWAAATITTVGYGDVYPTTGLGRGVAVFLMVTGIAMFGLLTANVAALFVDEDQQTKAQQPLEMAQIMARLDQLEQQIVQAAPRRRLPRLRSYRAARRADQRLLSETEPLQPPGT